MVVKALGNNSCVFSEEIGANAKRFGRRKVNTLASAECKLRVDHLTGHPVETSGCGHATFGFRSAPATA